jgi:2-(1,2-epoxy-1,2-dihydrophenyl)acetyl-CoA isomerase
MSDDPVICDISGGIAVLTLNRPDVMNALTTPMRAALTDALVRAGQTARVIVLTGAGRGFCSGQDLSEGAAFTGDVGGILRREYEPMLAAITDAPVPVIAAVNGVAAGAGANLALACDVVIAAESATFIQAFTRIGLAPDAGGTWTLPRQVGLPRALGAALFAEPVSARQAADWGMIWEAVPDADFAARWQARAAQLAAGPTVAYRAIRTAMRDGFANTLEAQLTLEAELQADCAATDDFREGLAAFAEKRKPKFTGR